MTTSRIEFPLSLPRAKAPRVLVWDQTDALAEVAAVAGDAAVVMARAAQWIGDGADVSAVAERAVRCAMHVVPLAQGATLTAASHGRVTTVASSDPAVTAVDQAQATARQGPVYETTTGEAPFLHSTDLAVDRRWDPAVAAEMHPAVRSVLSFQLVPSPRGARWALNLYAARPDVFGDDCEQWGRLLSAHVAVAMSTAYQRSNLEQAVAGRDVIGQAKGILMERYRLTADQAFQFLIRTSQTSNRKLNDIADQLARTGQLPAAEPAPATVHDLAAAS